jgi:hypothetical protein
VGTVAPWGLATPFLSRGLSPPAVLPRKGNSGPAALRVLPEERNWRVCLTEIVLLQRTKKHSQLWARSSASITLNFTSENNALALHVEILLVSGSGGEGVCAHVCGGGDFSSFEHLRTRNWIKKRVEPNMQVVILGHQQTYFVWQTYLLLG